MSCGVQFSRFTSPSNGAKHVSEVLLFTTNRVVKSYCRYTPYTAQLTRIRTSVQTGKTNTATYSPSVPLLLQRLMQGHAHCVIPPTSSSRLCDSTSAAVSPSDQV